MYFKTLTYLSKTTHSHFNILFYNVWNYEYRFENVMKFSLNPWNFLCVIWNGQTVISVSKKGEKIGSRFFSTAKKKRSRWARKKHHSHTSKGISNGFFLYTYKDNFIRRTILSQDNLDQHLWPAGKVWLIDQMQKDLNTHDMDGIKYGYLNNLSIHIKIIIFYPYSNDQILFQLVNITLFSDLYNCNNLYTLLFRFKHVFS